MREGMSAIEFDSFRLDLEEGLLRRDGDPLRLRPKSYEVLCHLARHAGRLVSKDELLAAVWPGVTVTEATLTTSIRELRVALGDAARAPRYIETVHGRGFRFLATLRAPAPVEGPRAAHGRLLVGRDAELDTLRACLNTARGGSRQVVFVTGEAGIGKTSLVDAFLAPLVADGRVALGRGQCVEGHGLHEPYMPVLEAIADAGRGTCRDVLAAALHRHAPQWLAHLPALRAAAETPASPRGDTGRHVPRLLADALDAFAATRLTVSRASTSSVRSALPTFSPACC